MIAVLILIGSLGTIWEHARGAPGIDFIRIVDAPGGTGAWVSGRDYLFGDTDAFWAAGYNATAGWVADVPTYWYYEDPAGDTLADAAVRTNVSYGPSVRIETNGRGIGVLRASDAVTGKQGRTGPLRVSVTDVDSVVLRTAPRGTGTWVGPRTYKPSEFDHVFYAAAYNATRGFLGDITSNWTASNPSLVRYSPGRIPRAYQCHEPVSPWCYPQAQFSFSPGSTLLSAIPVGTSVSNTTGLLTSLGIDYIRVEDAPNGRGSWVSGRNYAFGDTDTLWAASYNVTTGFVENPPYNIYWYSWDNASSWDHGVLRSDLPAGPSVRIVAGGYGQTRLRAALFSPMGAGGYLWNATGPIQVSVSNVDRVVIRTDRGGGGSWVGPKSYVEDDTQDFYAAAYNTTRGFLGDITANWSASDPRAASLYEYGNNSGSKSCGTIYGLSCYPYVEFDAVGGLTYVTASPAGTSVSNTTGKLTVTGIDFLRIVDGPNGTGSWVSGRDYMFGDTDSFWAALYNKTSGWVTDVAAGWSPRDRGGDGVIKANWGFYYLRFEEAIGTEGYGVTALRADWWSRNGSFGFTNFTGPIRVSIANVDRVVVKTDQAGTGTWVGATTYAPGDWDRFYAAAYNNTRGFLGDITSNWTSSNPGVGSISVPINSSQASGANFQALYPGFTYVSASPVGSLLSNATGRLTVTGIGMDSLQIRDAPNGRGTALGNRTYYPGQKDTFYAASYNRTSGFRGDVVGYWTSDDPVVCQVWGFNQWTAYGSSLELLLKSPGTCRVKVDVFLVSRTLTSMTGTLTVQARTLLTVDDSGGADFTRIQDAVDFAGDGYAILVYAGTYPEHVVVRKQVEILGESRDSVFLDAGGTGVALYIAADRVVVHGLTIRNSKVGVFQERTNNTRLYDNVISDYETGLFNEHTLNAWVAYNLITRGHLGVVTNVSYDDAIRWNEISHNSVYGAKSFNTRLRNCFNWNNFHDNAIAYFHDPTTDLPPMEFDGNVLSNNTVGVKVENTSSLRVTNNTISRGSEGVLLLNSSAEIRSNSFVDVRVGVRFHSSSANVTGNVITASTGGIVGDGGAPRIEGNDIRAASREAMTLINLDGAVIRGNDVHGGTILISNSRIALLAPVNSSVILTDTTVQNLVLDATSRVEIRWTIRVRAVDTNEEGLEGATISVQDSRGTASYLGLAGHDGFTPPFTVTVEVRTFSGIEVRNPFIIEGSSGPVQGRVTVAISGPGDIIVPVPVGAPRGVVAILAAAILLSGAMAGVFAVERSRYAFLSIFLPLYSRLSRDKVLESYNRGRVYQFIELNPGMHFHAILAALDMNSGSLVYHLEVLQREALVISRMEGMYRRFYPKGMKLPPVVENGTTPTQKIVLKAIQEMPGITQKELSRFLGLRQSTLAYQIDRLTAMGYVAGEKRGRKVHYSARKGGT